MNEGVKLLFNRKMYHNFLLLFTKVIIARVLVVHSDYK